MGHRQPPRSTVGQTIFRSSDCSIRAAARDTFWWRRFLMLVPMRMALEDLDPAEAVDAVLRQNIHGLELDQRCVAIAAFALALEAWRYQDAAGFRTLPKLNLGLVRTADCR